MADEEGQAEILPGLTVHGMDIGKWLARQGPRLPEPEGVHEAVQEGRERLRAGRYSPRAVNNRRAHGERLEDGTEVRYGVFLSNTKARRAKLTAGRLAALADLGLDWPKSVVGVGPGVM